MKRKKNVNKMQINKITLKTKKERKYKKKDITLLQSTLLNQ